MTHKLVWTGAAALLLALGTGGSALAQMSSTPSPNSPYSSGAMQNVPAAPTSLAAQIPISQVSDTSQLASATVQDSHGQQVGQVQKVRKSASGQATSVDIALNTPTAQGKVVNVKARSLAFDPGKRVVVAQLSSSELDTMPSANAASDTSATTSGSTSSPTSQTPAGSGY